MQTLSLPIASVVRECVATLMTFAFSRPQTLAWADKWLQGEFGQLRHTLLDIPAHRAERACLELAVLLRYLDDERGLSDHYRGNTTMEFGFLQKQGGAVTQLDLRDVVNKIIHARAFEWSFANPERPFLVALSREEEKWLQAEINVAALCVVGGSLIS